jgi:hypothetical protein
MSYRLTAKEFDGIVSATIQFLNYVS